MKRNGNVNTNRTFNPQNTKPPIPLDVDEVDAVLERFIRQKYDQQLFSSGRSRPAVRTDTGSTRSSEDQPPPLPPKPGKRFGFGLRSASSALPLQRSLPVSPHSPPGTSGFSGPPSPIRLNKQSRVFGASVGGGGGEFESKLGQLKDMGFNDEKRNEQTLKGLGGNLEKTIESLVRLGESSVPGSRPRSPNPPRQVAVSQPLPPPPSTQSTRAVNGISFAANGIMPQANIGSQGQQIIQINDLPATQATRNFTSPSPYPQPPNSHNPFDTFSQQTVNVPLENAFQGMQISQQPLFPNATGGYPSQPPAQEARFQTMTPPVPPMPQQYVQNNPFAQQNPMPNTNHNPFYQATQQHIPASSNPYVSNTQTQYNLFQQPSLPQPFNNGFSTESPQTYSPQVSTFQQQALQQQQTPEKPQPAQQQQQYTNPHAPQYSFINPAQYTAQNQQQPTQQYNQFLPQTSQSFDQYQPQPLQPQQTGRIDKSSILALYNYPQAVPPPLPTDSDPTPSAEQPMPNLPPRVKATQRSVTMPVQISSGSRNPFQVATATSIPANMYRHASQESVDLGGLQNGRHSPDAFASLSARFVR